MNIPRDKLLHIALGVLSIGCALAALMIHALFGLGPTLATAGIWVFLLFLAAAAWEYIKHEARK